MEGQIDAVGAVEELRRQLDEANRELHTARENLRRELEIANRVHSSLLPAPIRDDRICVDIRYLPIDEVGGDYCQVRFADETTCYITMCDVMGHGIAASLLAARVSSEVRYCIRHRYTPGRIVEMLNDFIYEYFRKAYIYLSFIAARIDLKNRSVTWSGAGHPAPLLVRHADTSVETLSSQNMLIGVKKDCLSDEPEHTRSLCEGDRLLFYTDGLTDAIDEQGQQLGHEGLARIASRAASVDLFDLADHILDRISRNREDPYADDKTLIVAEIR